MKRFVLAMVAVGAFASPAPASAHLLTVKKARAATVTRVRMLAAQKDRLAYSEVDACTRYASDRVACDYFFEWRSAGVWFDSFCAGRMMATATGPGHVRLRRGDQVCDRLRG